MKNHAKYREIHKIFMSYIGPTKNEIAIFKKLFYVVFSIRETEPLKSSFVKF